MPELIWDQKEAVKNQIINPVELKPVKKFNIFQSEKALNHFLFEGDNLLVLNQKSEDWKNKFHVIYIDPPYNTGNNDFFYNDNFKTKQSTDKHNYWLGFIYTRLKLAQKVLHSEGAIFISIDDTELYNLKLICDELFGEENFVANFIRINKSGAGHDSKKVAVEYDYMLCYAKNIHKLNFSKQLVNTHNDKKYRHKDEFISSRGKYYLRDLDYKGSYSKTLDYSIKTPDGKEIWPGGKFGKPNTWRWSEKKVKWGIENGYIVFKKRSFGYKVYIKQYQFVDNNDKPRQRKIPYRSLLNFSNAKGSNQLAQILPNSTFSYPKPTDLIEFILQLFSQFDSIEVLDFFAGSGTTLHATMLFNEKNKKRHTCTLITNNENNICNEVTYQRIKKAILGYSSKSGKNVTGLSNNNLKYFKAE